VSTRFLFFSEFATVLCLQFMSWFLFAMIVCVLFLVQHKKYTFFTVDEVDISMPLRMYILLMVGLNVIVAWLVELVLVPLAIRLLLVPVMRQWMCFVFILLSLNVSCCSHLYRIDVLLLCCLYFQPSHHHGSVLGKGVPQFGRLHKPYHPLRQAFESGWPSSAKDSGVQLQME
jgi:hypothetical protein